MVERLSSPNDLDRRYCPRTVLFVMSGSSNLDNFCRLHCPRTVLFELGGYLGKLNSFGLELGG